MNACSLTQTELNTSQDCQPSILDQNTHPTCRIQLFLLQPGQFEGHTIINAVVRPHKINYLICPAYHCQCDGKYFKFNFLSGVTNGYLRQNMLIPYMQIFLRGRIFHIATKYAKFRCIKNEIDKDLIFHHKNSKPINRVGWFLCGHVTLKHKYNTKTVKKSVRVGVRIK